MLWIGGTLGWIEQLSLRSFLAHGHPVRLFTYGPVGKIPEGVETRDGREILPLETIEGNRYANGSYALASNLFRYALLARNAGLWADIDVICVRPIAIDAPVIVGRENEQSLNGAVLYWRHDLAIAAEAVDAFRPGHVPNWLALRKRVGPLLRQLAGRDIHPRDLPHGTFGPKEVTALIKRHGLIHLAEAPEVFYPLAPKQAVEAFAPSLRYDDIVTPRTLTVHLWNEKLGTIKRQVPNPQSIVGRLAARHGIFEH
jgi:hypothetical protein